MPNLEDQLALILQEVKKLRIRVGGRVIVIGKYSFNSLEEWSSQRKKKISYCILGIIMDMKSLLEFFPIGLIDPLFNMLKQLRLGYPGGSYGMI